MPYPTKPDLAYSYTAAEQALGDGSLPGQELDTDLGRLRASIDETIDFLQGVMRSDGKLQNGVVTEDALGPSLRIGFEPPAPWATATDYTTRSTVFSGFGFYLCVVAHTSGGSFATDLAAGRWLLLADLTPPAGALIAANSLTDIGDAATGRTALGLSTMAQATAGTGSTEYRNNGAQDARFQPIDADLTAIAALTTTSFGRGLLELADATAARAALGVAPQSQNASGVGQVVALASTVGGTLSVPAGGTWEYFCWRNDSTSGVDTFAIAGVAAGGTLIVGAVAGQVHIGRAKRIL